MKTLVILVALVASYISSSQAASNCNAQFQQYRQCLQKSRPQESQQNRQAQQAKLQGLKAQVDACFTNNQCQPPQQTQTQASGNNNNQANSQCRKDFEALYKQKLTTCLQQSGVSLPQGNGGGDHEGGQRQGQRGKGGDHHEGGGAEGFKYNAQATQAALSSCPQKAAVQTCIQAAVKASFGQAGGADRKAQFQAFCAAKAQCDNQLGADCKAEMDKERKAACQCMQQQDAQQVRAQVPSCQGVQQPQQQGGAAGGKGRRQPKQINCDQQRDPCQSGGQGPFGQSG